MAAVTHMRPYNWLHVSDQTLCLQIDVASLLEVKVEEQVCPSHYLLSIQHREVFPTGPRDFHITAQQRK